MHFAPIQRQFQPKATHDQISDTDRINWLESKPLPTKVKGGLDDGHVAKFWGISAHSGTLRETIDHMILTGSERTKLLESE